MNKIKNYIEKIAYGFFFFLIESYGWRGFLLRLSFSIVIFIISTLGTPQYNMGTSGGKLWLAGWILVVYSFLKLAYDLTPSGRERQRKRELQIRNSKSDGNKS